ncbi:MAG: ATP-binding protein [Pseudodesulfovibrio sp.]
MSPRTGLKGRQLYRILFCGVIFTVLAVGAFAFWGVREVRRDAAVLAVENSARGLSGAVTVLVNAVTGANDEIDLKILSSLSPESLRHTLSAMLERHPNLASVMVADAGGLRYMLSRRDDGVVETVPGSWRFVRADGTAEAMAPPVGFDRAVVDKALAAEFAGLQPGQVRWRSASRFHSAGESWLTASSLVESGGKQYLMSYVFPIDAVARQLEGAEKGGAERIFLYWASGLVLPISGLGVDQEQTGRVSRAFDADAVPDPVIAGATRMLAKGRAEAGKPFSYTVDGGVWWGYVLPLSVFGDTMALGVAVPWKNIVSTLTSDNFLLFFGGVLVLLATAGLIVLHRFRDRIKAMGLRQRTPRTDQDVLRLIAEGESATLEFKQTLRFNLKAGKNGREIEHASLKTVAGFMNSEGGILLVGVADDGVVTGFDEDRFESADKALLHFNNLVNQCIGTEFARYLDTAIIEVQGRAVLRVHCLPAKAPAFLRDGKAEEFYVRSGPASRQLSLIQFYEWLKKH